MSFDKWSELAATTKLPTQAFIDGAFGPAASGATFQSINPATGAVTAEIARCGQEDVDRAVAAARRAFKDRSWAGMEPKRRKRVLMKMADLIKARGDELALAMTLEMGKPIKFASGEVAGAINVLRWYAEAVDKVYGEMGPTGDSDLSMVVREPLGVIAAVVPWNFPLMMAMWKIAPALATGNCLILKPAEQSPLSALVLADILKDAGLPDGVFQVVPGFGPEVGQPLGLHMDVNMVTFTGSTAVGKLFMQFSGQSNMKRISTECGGKSPHIIMADCPDLEAAAEAAAEAIFFNCGQVCTAGSRLFVQREIHDDFLALVKQKAAAWKADNPLDPKTIFGSMVNEEQMNTALKYIEIGKEEGTLELGGNRANTDTGGFFVEPTIFSGISNDSRMAQEEIFGPVLSVIAFDTPEEALEQANDNRYGLGAAVWSKDISTALRTARGIESGMVWVNCWDGCDITVPFGGYKESGIGRDRSLHAMEKYTEQKLIWVRL